MSLGFVKMCFVDMCLGFLEMCFVDMCSGFVEMCLVDIFSGLVTMCPGFVDMCPASLIFLKALTTCIASSRVIEKELKSMEHKFGPLKRLLRPLVALIYIFVSFSRDLSLPWNLKTCLRLPSADFERDDTDDYRSR